MLCNASKYEPMISLLSASEPAVANSLFGKHTGCFGGAVDRLLAQRYAQVRSKAIGGQP